MVTEDGVEKSPVPDNFSAEAGTGFFLKNPTYMGEIARRQSLFRCFLNQGGIYYGYGRKEQHDRN